MICSNLLTNLSKRVETIDDIYNDDVARLIPGIEKWLYNMPLPPTLDITHVVNIYIKNEYKYIHTTLEYVL